MATDSLTELLRLAEEAADEAEGDWFDPALLEPGAPPISASAKARAFMQAFDPDTAKKLIAVARAWESLRARVEAYEVESAKSHRLAEMDEAMQAALEELK